MEVKIKRWKTNTKDDPHRKGSVKKCEVKVEYGDDWSADWTIAQIAAPLLVQLQQKKQGAPLVDDEDVPEELRSTSCAPKENVWDIDDNHFKRWDWALSEMIFAMQEIANDNENEPEMFKHIGDVVFGEVNEETGLGPILSTGVEIIPEMEEPNRHYQERVQNGCRLFGKYFRNLWS